MIIRMNVGRLEISTQQAKIEFGSQYARVSLHQTLPRFTMTRIRGGMTVNVQHPQLIVDSSACHAEEGDESVSQFIAETAQQGVQDAMDAASQSTQDAYYIMRNFHSSRSVLADLAGSKAQKQPQMMNLRFIPSELPQVGFTDNVFDMTVQPDAIQIDWDVSTTAGVQVTQEGGVDIRMAQYPQITFDYIAPPALDVSA